MKLFWKRNAPLELPDVEAQDGIETQPPYSDMLRRLQRIFLSPGPPGAMGTDSQWHEDWDNFIDRKYEDDFVHEFSSEWIEPFLYLYTHPSVLIEATMDEEWEGEVGRLLGRVARRFPAPMLPSICLMLHTVETRLIAICALDSYGEPDALPYLKSLADQTGQMREEEIVAFIEAIESVIYRTTDDAVKREAENLLRHLGRVIPSDFAEAFQRLGIYATQRET